MIATQRPPANWIVVLLKVVTDTLPFNEYQNITARVKITLEERPSRPTNPALTDDVWALMEICWHQDPRSRPEMKRVLHDLASSLLRNLRQFTESSPEFQVALGQFFDNTERKGYIDLLRGAELKEFANFLDDVRSRLNLPYITPGCDFSYRCYAPRGRVRIYCREYCTTCRRCVASGPHFRTPT